MDQDSFRTLSVDKWADLKNKFKLYWPSGITGYYALDTLEKWLKLGMRWNKNGFQVLNPFGIAQNGMVVVLKDNEDFMELLIECPQDNTSQLEEALRGTNLIDWDKDIFIIFPQKRIMDCLKRTLGDIDLKIVVEFTLKLYVLTKDTPLYKVSLPQGFTFKELTEDYLEVYDSTWPHRYPGSIKYFQLLIQSKSGYGLFKDDQLVSFGFVKEMGALGHLYTLEEHRRKGYGEIVTKLICNERLKEAKDVFSFCIDGNLGSCKMHEKLGFLHYFDVSAVILTRSTKPLSNFSKSLIG